MDSEVESMTDQQRLELWMHSARRLRVLADLAEKVLLAIGCLVIVLGAWQLVNQMYVGGVASAASGLGTAIFGALLGAIGQNQASVNECNCRMLDQLRRMEHALDRR